MMGRRDFLKGSVVTAISREHSSSTMRPLEFGAYFIPMEQWQDALTEGLSWCAWPPIVPDTHGNGEGFVTKRVVVNLVTKNEVPYPRDEVPDPENLAEPDGSFITIARRELGLNASRLSSRYDRGIVNYFLFERVGYWRDAEDGILTAHRCADAWRGTPWTAVINANVGGLLDRASERGAVPADVLLDQIRWYRQLGASRIFFWRWDTPNGLLGIIGTMRRISRGEL